MGAHLIGGVFILRDVEGVGEGKRKGREKMEGKGWVRGEGKREICWTPRRVTI